MSIATQDARDGASMQVSIAEFIEGSACDSGESTKSDEKTCEVAQRDDTRDDLDYSQEVFITEHGDHYHAVQYGLCACPHVNGTEVTLEEAVEDGNLPCSVCGVVDFRQPPDPQPTTLEGFS